MNTKSISDRLMNKGKGKEKKVLGNYSVIINCLMGSVISVIVVMVFAFIQMMFKSGEDGRRETFFGSLYFESSTLKNGNVEINMGLDNGLTVLIIMAVVAVVYYLIYKLVSKKIIDNK